MTVTVDLIKWQNSWSSAKVNSLKLTGITFYIVIDTLLRRPFILLQLFPTLLRRLLNKTIQPRFLKCITVSDFIFWRDLFLRCYQAHT